MRILITTMLISLFLSLSTTPVNEDVYICISPTAKAYHKGKDACKGIRACTHKILKVSKEEAIKKYKYRACRFCY